MTKDREQMLLHPTPDCNYSLIYQKKALFQDFCQDPDIFEMLHNPILEKQGADPEDYYCINVYPFLKIPDVQSVAKNFICYEVNDLEDYGANNVMMRRQITIRVMCDASEVDTPYGIPRQDVLAMLIDERMQWTEVFGSRLEKVYDAGKTSENGYYYRNMYYEQTTPNNLQRGFSENALDAKGRGYYAIEDSFI
ncbi:MAG: hypothetical protein [Bacteriophage sp.]|nr:MAG: hypothetical protein [Bacteriophage sp.]